VPHSGLLKLRQLNCLFSPAKGSKSVCVETDPRVPCEESLSIKPPGRPREANGSSSTGTWRRPGSVSAPDGEML
jgi:hypothetical protein